MENFYALFLSPVKTNGEINGVFWFFFLMVAMLIITWWMERVK